MILVSGHQGYGDNLYMRPFVQALREQDEVAISTPWPELHPGCRYVRPRSRLYHAERNEAQQNCYGPEPKNAREIVLEYSGDAPRLSLMQSFSKRSGIEIDRLEWDVPPEPYMPGPYCIFHPPTIRTEYRNAARNPDPASFKELLDLVRERMPIIAVADLRPSEVVDGVYHYDRGHLNGQLPLHRLPGVVRAAALVVTSPCFLLPLAMSVGAKTICMFGGHHPPRALIPGGNEVTVLAPEPFCPQCHQSHECKKLIPEDKIRSAFEQTISPAFLCSTPGPGLSCASSSSTRM